MKILGIDRHSIIALKQIIAEEHWHKIQLFDANNRDVLDPYYGSDHDFDLMIHHIEEVAGLIG